MARIFFSGAEKSTLASELITNGVEALVFSYFYVSRRESDWAGTRRLLVKNPNVKVFLNSGSYTYRSARVKNLPLPDKYYRQYLDFISLYARHFEYVAEFDLDGIWTPEAIEQAREELWKLNVNVVPVWRKERGVDVFKSYLADPRVKCIAIAPDQKNGHKETGKYVSMALLAGKQVHGIAMTKFQTTLKNIHYTSVDSNSWMAGDRYGDIYIFEHNKWTLLPSTEKGARERYQHYWKAIKCDVKKILKGDAHETRKANIIAWSRMAKRFELIHKFRRTSDKAALERETEQATELKMSGVRQREEPQVQPNVIVKDGRIYFKKPAPKPVVVVAPPPENLPETKRKAEDMVTRYEEPGGFGFLSVMPKFACSTCSIAADCPEYKEGFVCAFTNKLSAFGTRDMGEIRELMRKVVQQNALRLQRGLIREELSTGGQIDKDVTQLSSLVLQQAKSLAELENAGHGLKIMAQGKGVSLLSALFSRPKPMDEHQDEVIDVTSKKVSKA